MTIVGSEGIVESGRKGEKGNLKEGMKYDFALDCLFLVEKCESSRDLLMPSSPKLIWWKRKKHICKNPIWYYGILDITATSGS